MNTYIALRKIVTLTLLVACGSVFTACSLDRQAKKQEEVPVKPEAGMSFKPHVPEYDYALAPSPAQMRSAENTGLNGVPEYQPRYQGQPFQAPAANTATAPQYQQPSQIQRKDSKLLNVHNMDPESQQHRDISSTDVFACYSFPVNWNAPLGC